MPDPRTVFDQSAHAATAFAALFIALQFGIVGGAVAGLMLGMIREVAESGTPVTFAKVKAQLTGTDASIDLAFWTLGGLIAGALA